MPLTQLLPFLYVGDTEDALCVGEHPDIQYLLNCAREIPKDRKIARNLHYSHLLLDDNDRQELIPHLHGAFLFIEQARLHKQACLLYSQFGISRSVSVALAYLARFRTNLPIPPTYDDTLRWIRERRPSAAPNPGFERALRHMIDDDPVTEVAIPRSGSNHSFAPGSPHSLTPPGSPHHSTPPGSPHSPRAGITGRTPTSGRSFPGSSLRQSSTPMSPLRLSPTR